MNEQNYGPQCVPITVNTIDNGEAVEQVNQLIKRLSEDVIARPHLNAARSISLTFTIKPGVNEATGQNFPIVSWAVKNTYPTIKSAESRGIVKNGEIHINVDDLQNPMQASLFSLKEESA